jgi:hypothetical protein
VDAGMDLVSDLIPQQKLSSFADKRAKIELQSTSSACDTKEAHAQSSNSISATRNLAHQSAIVHYSCRDAIHQCHGVL